MNIVWSDPAKIDLNSIEAYIADSDPRAAIRTVLQIIEKAETMLPENMHIGRAGRVFDTRELVIPRLPYIVVYQLAGNTIAILRVLHQAQKWPQD